MSVFLFGKPNPMSKNLLALIFVATCMAGCGTEEKAQLQSKVDSLTVELETSQRMARTLQDVGVLMDSIDANRQLLRVNMVEGTTYDDYTSRMKDLNNYVRETENKIEDLEKQLKKSKSNANAFAATIKKMKAELFSKSEEISALQEKVEMQRNENQNLSQTIKLQEDELTEKDALIQQKEEELALIETRIQELMINSKVSEADALYARAQAVEETANRTVLAPKKKKSSYKEAIELYKKSLSLGKKEAQARITELEKKIK
jgi:TolA-binding protein